MDIKLKFFNYIGPEDSLVSYVRSYKLVFLKCMLAIMDSAGKANVYQIANEFKNYYVSRIRAGLMPDYNVDSRIMNADQSSIEDILKVIKDNPFNAISKSDFIFLKEIDGEEYFLFNPQLVKTMTSEDYIRLKDLLERKLKNYYTKIDKQKEFMDLKSIFAKMLDEYYVCRTSQPFAGNAMGELFRKTIVNTLYSFPFIDQKTYLIKGSVGQGNWATVPWICLFDRRITTTAQQGVFIVYLLSEDGNTLFLTLNQGCTKLIGARGKRDAIQIMQDVAKGIRNGCRTTRFTADSNIVLGNEYYEKGCIFYKAYSKENVPEQQELLDDLEEMIKVYQQYYDEIFSRQSENLSKIEDMILEKTIEQEPEIDVSSEVTRIAEYITAKGFSYEKGVIENLYLCLKSKPFVILAGTSGTGKTKLIKLFAEAIDASENNGQFQLVPVRPDWSDSTDLFGHVDLNGRFIPGVIIDFIKTASENRAKPFFLCLDEMNLARVEYYLSDILSVIETRRREDGHIITDSLVSKGILGYQEDSQKYVGLQIPENLYIVGTVNMDETTFPFSKKVLDRANTIEFSYVNLDAAHKPIGRVEKGVLNNSFLKSDYLLLGEIIDMEDAIDEVISLLKQINEALVKVNAQIGYRVRDEICFYIAYNEKYGLIGTNEAKDNAILQKILPRLQGSSMSIKKTLIDLFKICISNHEDLYQSSNNAVSDVMFGYLKTKEVPFKRSAAKIAFMTRRFEDDGFTSYWV